MKTSRFAAVSLFLVSTNFCDFVKASQPPGTENSLVLNASYTTGTEVPWTAHGFTPRGGTVNFSLNGALTPGTQLMVVKNTSADFIDGAFDNLVQGQVVTLSFGGKFHPYLANYFGGTGNDLVLLPAATRAFAWGENSGTLGDGTNTNRATPAPVLNSGVLAGGAVVALAAGTSHSLALRSDRIGSVGEFANEVKANLARKIEESKSINWQFTNEKSPLQTQITLSNNLNLTRHQAN